MTALSPRQLAALGLGSRRSLLTGLGLATLAACAVESPSKGSAELRADIQKELQVDANVSVNEFGGKVVVTITFQARPSGDLDVARDRAVAMARARLPDATRVDVFTRL
jgi:hypothetical protein